MLPNIRVPLKLTLMVNLKDLVLGLGVAFFFWPFCILLYIINFAYRRLVIRLYERAQPGHYTLSDGEDAVFGTKVVGNCNSLIQGYQILTGQPDLNLIRLKFSHMLRTTNADYSRFRQIFTRKYGYFCWAKDPSFEISNHIHLVDHPDLREREADEAKIHDYISEITTKGMGTDKPQWEILIVPRYRLEGQTSPETNHYCIITRFNHAYADAISYFLMVNAYIADSPAELPMDPTKPFKVPLWAQAIIWAKVFVLGPLNFISILAHYVFEHSAYRAKPYSDSKMVARSVPIPLETVKQVKLASGASVTAILFTAIYSALHKAHVRLFKDEPLPRDLHLANVMAMFPYWTKRKLGNQFTLWPYSAPMKIDSLVERLEVSSQLTQAAIGSPDPVFDWYVTRALGSLPCFVHSMLWSLSGSPIMLSNVPGYSSRLKLYGGEMVDGAGFIPLMSTTGVGLSTQTYCGELRISGMVDPKIFSRRSELQQFLDEVISELRELANIYNVGDENNNSSPNTTTTPEDVYNSPQPEFDFKFSKLDNIQNDFKAGRIRNHFQSTKRLIGKALL